MNEQELCKKRLIDLSKQAEHKNIVLFSDFLNLNEQSIYHANKNDMFSKGILFGGYDSAERQMIAFIPDALSYEWEYPIFCLKIRPLAPKFAENLTHRDILGAIMNLGIDRSKLGDILCKENNYYVFCEEIICKMIHEQLSRIRHTTVIVEDVPLPLDMEITPDFEEINELVASNRIDGIIAKAYHLSRSEAANHIASEKVFVNGKCITNCNTSLHNSDIVSVRGKGRFVFYTNDALSKKGKLRILIKKYI